MMSWIDSRHWKISTVCHFQNVSQKFNIVRHISNCDDIGQCWIFAILWWPFWKWQPVEIFKYLESIQDIIIYPHIKFWWYRTMLNFCCIAVAILKMVTSRNWSQFDMWVDNDFKNWVPTFNNFYCSPFSKWLPQYCKKSTLSNMITIWYVVR
jgi:hypothetical protein